MARTRPSPEPARRGRGPDTGPLRRVGPPPLPPRSAPDTAQLPAVAAPPPNVPPMPAGASDEPTEDQVGGWFAADPEDPDGDADGDRDGNAEHDGPAADPDPWNDGADPDGPPLTALPDAPGAEATGAEVLDVPGGPPATASTGRAGRDMAAAISVGLGLAAVILLALLIWRPAFLLVLTAAVLISVVELTRALAKGGYRPALPPLVVGSLAIVALAWTRGPTGLVVAFLLTTFAVLLWRLGDGPVGYLRDASAAVLVALYVPLLAGFAVLLLAPDDGVARVLTFIGLVVCSDVGGFAAGVLAGKHPLAKSVSPKKSWEGLGGSVAACVLLGTLLVTLTFHGPWWGGVLFGVAMALTATLGDLGESLVKRDLAIKDMGDLLPGHGGLMDRMDSLLPSAAVAYLVLSIVAPV
jgi:phosphatidate cytidylyltransferase